MRTVRTKVYQFGELTEDAKQKAIESFYDLNIDFDWWDCTYDDFKQLAATIGVDVDLKATYFSGFGHQGQGSSFTADIDVKKCMLAVRDEKWKEYAPKEKLSFYPVTKNMLRLADICSCSIEPSNRESSVKIDFECDKYANNDTPNVDAVIDEIESFFEDLANELNSLLFRLLEQEYEYRTSEEAIIEGIIANEYEFTKDGNRF